MIAKDKLGRLSFRSPQLKQVHEHISVEFSKRRYSDFDLVLFTSFYIYKSSLLILISGRSFGNLDASSPLTPFESLVPQWQKVANCQLPRLLTTPIRKTQGCKKKENKKKRGKKYGYKQILTTFAIQDNTENQPISRVPQVLVASGAPLALDHPMGIGTD